MTTENQEQFDDSQEEETVMEMKKTREAFHKFMDVQETVRFAHHRRMPKEGPFADQTRGRGRIIALLNLKDGIATKEMAQILGIRVSSLNELLAKLEKDGYITRTPSEADKRVMLVSLTEKGAEEAQKPHGCFPDKVFEGFSDEELDALEGYLDRMAANITSNLDEESQEMLAGMREKRSQFYGHGRCHGGHGPKGHHGPGRGCGHKGPEGHQGPEGGPGHGHGCGGAGEGERHHEHHHCGDHHEGMDGHCHHGGHKHAHGHGHGHGPAGCGCHAGHHDRMERCGCRHHHGHHHCCHHRHHHI